jgi:hypothetical protein
MRTRWLQLAAAMALAAGTGCGKAVPATPGVPMALQNAGVSHAAGITVSPKKLAFTTTKLLLLTITERGYTGSFKIATSSRKIVKVSAASAKGPGPVKIKATAVAAGAATITVSDSKGHKAKVPVSVTTAVVVIQ